MEDYPRDFPRPSKVKLWSWLTTGAMVLVVLNTDFGPEPHALSGIQNSFKRFKTWVLKPSSKELDELQTRYRMQLSSDKTDSASSVKPRD